MNENLTDGGASQAGRRAAAATPQGSGITVPEIVPPSAAPLTRRELREQAAPAMPVTPVPPAQPRRPSADYAREILGMPATIPAARVPELVTVPPARIERPAEPARSDYFAGQDTVGLPVPPQAYAPQPRPVITGYRPSADYAREVLAMPPTVPPAGIPAAEETIDFDKLIADEAPVDFDRMIAEEATPDFELLAAAEADEAFRAAMLPPGPAPAGAGGLDGFAVYGDPEPIKPEVIRPQTTLPSAVKAAMTTPEPAPVPSASGPAGDPEANPLLAAAGAGGLDGFAVYGDPETSGPTPSSAPAAAKDPNRDLGITEKPDFYDEPTNGDVIHDVRFTPGKTLSVSNRRVYRADNRGIPIFSPGWTARMAAAYYRRGLFIAVTIAFLLTVATGGMVYLAVGADSSYVAVAENGTVVEATVASVTADVQKDTTKTEPSTTSSNVATTETAVVKFELNGKPYTRNITDTSTDPTAMLGVGSAWKAGSKVKVIADLDHSGQVIREDTSKTGRFNFLSLSPLLLAAAFITGAVAAGINTGKMMRIDNAETAAARDEKK